MISPPPPVLGTPLLHAPPCCVPTDRGVAPGFQAVAPASIVPPLPLLPSPPWLPVALGGRSGSVQPPQCAPAPAPVSAMAPCCPGRALRVRPALCSPDLLSLLPPAPLASHTLGTCHSLSAAALLCPASLSPSESRVGPLHLPSRGGKCGWWGKWPSATPDREAGSARSCQNHSSACPSPTHLLGLPPQPNPHLLLPPTLPLGAATAGGGLPPTPGLPSQGGLQGPLPRAGLRSSVQRPPLSPGGPALGEV